MVSSAEPAGDAARNLAYWNRIAADYHERNARFSERGRAWGLWQVPDAELEILGDVAGKDVLERGRGEAEWSRSLAREGGAAGRARPLAGAPRAAPGGDRAGGPPRPARLGGPAGMSDHVEGNRVYWTAEAERYAAWAAEAWARPEIAWGIWNVPESELRVLDDVAGKDVVELGCGTGYFGSWLARRGAHVTGVDVTEAQLATARGLAEQHRLPLRLVLASAEDVPLPDASFDLVLSEYGASLWCDPFLWIPEAARLLRPGGQLVFLTNHLVLTLCTDPETEAVGERLAVDAFGPHATRWPDGATEFHLRHGQWIELLRANGFDVEGLWEPQAPEEAGTRRDRIAPEWARRWPSEEIWKARKR